MEPVRPSRTALRVALRRAAHQVYDPQPHVLEDPIAVPILGKEYAEELRKTATKLHKPFSAALRAFVVARSRYAEDTLVRAVANGVTQYVLLGAGLDTFAYRNPHSGLRVFEVDHPATQAWKRELLERNGIAIPASLSFVAVDFERDSLAEQLELAGFDKEKTTVFAWLGVVPYLTLEAFRGTVAFMAQCAAGSEVVFDYGQPRHTLPFLEQLASDSLGARVAMAGEPFQLFFTPEEVSVELRQTDPPFRVVEDLGSEELNERYFAGRRDKLRARGSMGRLLAARV